MLSYVTVWIYFAVYNETFYDLRHYRGGADATQPYALKEEHCRFGFILHSYSETIFHPLPFFRFELLKRHTATVSQTGPAEMPWVRRKRGPGVCALGYRANTTSLKTFAPATQCSWDTNVVSYRKKNQDPSEPCPNWIGHSSPLCSLSVHASRVCIQYVQCVCLCGHWRGIPLSLQTTFLDLASSRQCVRTARPCSRSA